MDTFRALPKVLQRDVYVCGGVLGNNPLLVVWKQIQNYTW